MARLQKLEVGGLNVRVHPHDQDTYGNLITQIYEMRKIAKIHGDRFGLVTTLDHSEEDRGMVYGVLSTFLEVEIDGDWFNTATMDEASENDIRKIRIPNNLHPNLKKFRFAFNTKRHELIFEHYSEGERLTHNSALNFFRNVTNDRRIQDRFGDVKVSVVTDRGSVDRIFSIPRITDLDILIEKPNSDVWGADFEEQAEEHLNDKNARSMNVKYKAERGQGIQRDEDLNALLQASLNNGRSVAKGYGPDGHMTVSTESFPKVVQEKYEPEIAPVAVFRRLASRFRR